MITLSEAGQIISLVIPFIALIFFIGMAETITIGIINVFKKIPKLPNSYGFFFAFTVTLIGATTICYLGDFRFFSFLGVDFINKWVDYLFTGLVITKGSKFLKSRFDLVNQIPSIISGLRVFKNNNNENTINPEVPRSQLDRILDEIQDENNNKPTI